MALDTTLILNDGTEIRARSVGAMDNISYLLTPAGGNSLLIDAAADPDALIDLVADRNVAGIVTTHRHPDHWQALTQLAEHTEADLIAGSPDAEAIAEGAGVHIDTTVWDGDRIALGELNLEVLGLVGHTPGGIALVLDTGHDPVHVFTGDCLFPGGVGKTHNPEDFTTLLDGVEQKLFDRFDDDTVVHPGHGTPTTLGAERGSLAEWRERGW